QKELERIAGLRDECLGQAWPRENLPPKTTKHKNRQTNNDNNSGLLQFKSQSALDITTRPPSATMSQRTGNKKKRPTTTQNRKAPRSRSAMNVYESNNVLKINYNQWLLPETEEYLHGNKEQSTSGTENEQQTEVVTSV
ncbi:unnamed protein product, partial [Adineta steineri]